MATRHTFQGHVPRKRDKELSKLLEGREKAKVPKNNILLDDDGNIIGYECHTIFGKGKIPITEKISRMRYPDAPKGQEGYKYFVRTFCGEDDAFETIIMGLAEIHYSDLSEQEKLLFGWWGQAAVRAAISPRNKHLSVLDNFRGYKVVSTESTFWNEISF